MTVPLTERAGRVVRPVTADLLGRFLPRLTVRIGGVCGYPLAIVARIPGPSSAVGSKLCRRSVEFSASVGAEAFVTGLIGRLGRSSSPEVRMFCHGVFLSRGQFERAAAIEHDRAATWPSTSTPTLLRADREAAAGDPRRALRTLDTVRRTSSEVTRRRVALLQATGRASDVVEALSDVDADVSPTARAAALFDAHWALGDPERAAISLSGIDLATARSVDILRRRRMVCRYFGADENALIDEARGGRPDWRDGCDWATTVRLQLGMIDELIAESEDVGRLGATARFNRAAALYISRDLDAAGALLRQLRGTIRHWDAEKLEARILLERGRFEEALANRRSAGRLRPALDEVAYFALLHLGMDEAAFGSYLPEVDRRRMSARFGASFDPTGRATADVRFVVAQDGPGDEILTASTYATLSETSTVEATCDVRLAPLLQRSFPAITFRPTRRQASRPLLGFLHPDRPRRDTGACFDLLTRDAAEAALRSSRVTPARSLTQLTVGRAPFAPYLVPDVHLVAEMRRRVGATALGVVWRSEFNDPIRSIHYLRPSDMRALRDVPGAKVCLQHDATAEERAELRRELGEEVRFLDDIDLRDDFEATAAVVAACHSVVGVGTTMVELSAAVGTQTITLHPNRIGSWRGRHPGGGDYWHRAMRTACADDPSSPRVAVDRARAMLTSR